MHDGNRNVHSRDKVILKTYTDTVEMTGVSYSTRRICSIRRNSAVVMEHMSYSWKQFAIQSLFDMILSLILMKTQSNICVDKRTSRDKNKGGSL